MKCPYCGAYKQEELSNEEVTLLYNAAQKLRLASFDESEEMYLDIIKKYPKNSEAYWGLVLSKYAIKYEDDYDGKKLPTCFGTTIESILEDKDYLQCISLCEDQDQINYLKEQAKVIEKIRKEWLEKASKEPQYDVFLCFKDSDKENNIERTDDSIEVANLYTHLSGLGYKVFFSRESLRDKVAEKYEPYIYNALNSATLMVVYGSNKQYFTSTWMQNEWTRFIRRIREGKKVEGSLVIACDGVNPSELPKALSSMQVLDARKKTFYGDLERHIAKIVSATRKSSVAIEKIEIKSVTGKVKSTVSSKIEARDFGTYVVPELTLDIKNKIKHVNRFIVNEMYDNATEILDELLDKNKENGQVLLLKLFTNLKVKNLDEALTKIETYDNIELVKAIIENSDKEIGEKIVIKIANLLLENIGSEFFDTWFSNISSYNFNGREEWIDRLLEKAYKIQDISKQDKLFGEIVDCISSDNVQKHILVRLDIANHFRTKDNGLNLNFILAKKYYNEVLEIEEGNYEALQGIFLCNLKTRDFNELDSTIINLENFEDVENVLKYAPLEKRIFFISSLVNKVQLCSKNKNIDYKKLERIFEHLLKYYPEDCNEIFVSQAFDFAENCKLNSKFDIAEKYYALVLSYNNTMHKAYWGLLQVKLKCRNNDDLIHQKALITSEKDFNSAIAAAGDDDRSADKYVHIAKEQKDYLEKQARKEKAKAKRKKITTIVAIACAVVLAITGSLVGYNTYRKSESILKYIELEDGYSVYAGKYFSEEYVEIPEYYNNKKVISIAENGFKDNTSIREVVLTSNIEEICDNAFSGCTNLESVKFTLAKTADISDIVLCSSTEYSNSSTYSRVTKLGDSAFYNCSSLQSIDISNALEVGEDAFNGCSELREIELCNDLTVLKKQTFYGCGMLQEVTLPESLQTIEKACFGDCISLKSLTIPESTTTIEGFALVGCSSLTNIIIEAREGDISGFDEDWYEGVSNKVEIDTVFKVLLDYNGATGNNTIHYGTAKYNENYTLPIPTKSGYTFLGWYDSNNEKLTQENGDSLSVFNYENSISVIAKWQANLNTIEFNSNGGEGMMPNQKIATDSRANINECAFTKHGYHFIGWGVNTANVEYEDKEEYNMGINSTYVLYAIWEANANTLKFDGNGATSGSMANMTINTDDTKVLSTNAFARLGYDFIGWSTTNNNVKEYSDNELYTMGVNDEYTLYAVWTIHSYTISYHYNDENSLGKVMVNNNPKTYTINDSITFENLNRPGYTFISWSVQTIEKGTYGNKDIYANWEANTNAIIFDGNGATSGTMSNEEIKSEETKKLSNNLYERLGYDFIGWAETPTGNVVYTNEANYTHELLDSKTLYAKWDIISYTITYNLNGGILSNVVSSYTVLDEIVLNTPTKDYYNFIGWTGSNLVEYSTNIYIPIGSTGNKEYTANWSPIVYTISYNLDGGNGLTETTYTIETETFTLQIPTKNNATFDGWSGEGIDGNTINVEIKKGSFGNVLYVANWIECTEGLQFTLNSDNTYSVTGYIGTSSNVIIPRLYIDKTVTSINVKAFYENTIIEMVKIPNSIQNIGAFAFSGCKGIIDITIPYGVTSIESNAFSKCTSLKSVVISNSVTSISNQAFLECTALEKITMSCSVTSMGVAVFARCVSLKDIIIPNGVTCVGGGMFSGCSALTSVSIPNSVTSIGGSAFCDCVSLTRIEIPNSVINIGSAAFQGCVLFTSIEIPNSVTYIGQSVFAGCYSLKKVIVPFIGESKELVHNESNGYGSEKALFGYFFNDDKRDGCTRIGQSYARRSEVFSVYIPDSIEYVEVSGGEIQYGAFQNCSKIKTIVLNEDVNYIGFNSVEGCDALSLLVVNQNKTWYKSIYSGFVPQEQINDLSSTSLIDLIRGNGYAIRYYK